MRLHQRRHNKETIASVVDDGRWRSSCETCSLGGGFEVVTAQSGFECMDLSATSAPSILLDLTMPFMDGEETFGRLRSIRRMRRPSEHRLYRQGKSIEPQRWLAGFLRKPHRPDELVQILGRPQSVRCPAQAVSRAPASLLKRCYEFLSRQGLRSVSQNRFLKASNPTCLRDCAHVRVVQLDAGEIIFVRAILRRFALSRWQRVREDLEVRPGRSAGDIRFQSGNFSAKWHCSMEPLGHGHGRRKTLLGAVDNRLSSTFSSSLPAVCMNFLRLVSSGCAT
jgi:CheY-like chemotaxis protein